MSNSLPAKELVVRPEALDADEYLHPALKRRVNSTERGSVNLRDLASAVVQVPTAAKLRDLFNYVRGEDPDAIFTERTTSTRVENDLIKLAREQAELIQRMAIDANIPCGEHRLKGFNRDADPLSGIVGPTQAVYKRYKLDLDGIA